MHWYSLIRHSLDTRFMVRFPKKCFLVKAREFHKAYKKKCLREGIKIAPLRINYKGINRLLRAYGVTSRKPNRKFKVSRETLSQRAKLYWLSTARVRKLIQLAHGYDPVFTSMGQSHFHMNQTGSCEDNTIVLKGCPTVPLHEKHAPTRQRYSLTSVTHSDEDAIRRELPGFEMMFRAEKEKMYSRT